MPWFSPHYRDGSSSFHTKGITKWGHNRAWDASPAGNITKGADFPSYSISWLWWELPAPRMRLKQLHHILLEQHHHSQPPKEGNSMWRCSTCKVCAPSSKFRKRAECPSFALTSHTSSRQNLPLLPHSAHSLNNPNPCTLPALLWLKGFVPSSLKAHNIALTVGVLQETLCHRDSSLGTEVIVDIALLCASSTLPACL